jgi:subtilisin family serine protease
LRLIRKSRGCLLAAVVTVAALVPAGPVVATRATSSISSKSTAGSAGHAAAPARTVTLITGDRIKVFGEGTKGLTVQPGKGRERIGFVARDIDGHTSVVPVDAIGMLNAGKLDPRLFDVTTLLQFGYDDKRDNLPLIVTSSSGPAQATARIAGASVGRELPAVRGVAVKQSRRDAAAFWNGLTAQPSAKASVRALRAGFDKIWLDGVRQGLLDVSVPQIGAPDAWKAGYTGEGVPVGVVDTGVDSTHPDLAGRVVAEQNFTDDADASDTRGHGTHVASTIAGSGAASGGKYKGVAPGAKLSSAKVCMSHGCPESSILAGMQWAAADQHAKVINMSLGGPNSPEVDPIEESVRTLTAKYGTLFVVAAGNDGEDGSVASPATADDALAVGAVSTTEALAEFSSRGPRVGDWGIKPEITGPGVSIVAASAKKGTIGTPVGSDGRYRSMSGTSMATPHVAGSAAILAQQHPDWSPAQLKATLMASAKPNPAIGVYAQGAGRVDLRRAIGQTVTTSPTAVSFGEQKWPHHDDTPISRTVTYHNAGTAAVTLNLAVHASGPDGKPAAAGLFTVSPAAVTVAAGGDATVTVTADTRAGPTDGFLGGELTATAGDQAVQTPVAVVRETEHYDLTVSHLNRDGTPSAFYRTLVVGLDKPGFYSMFDPSGTATMRLPRGRYLITTYVMGGTNPTRPEVTQLVQPELDLPRQQTVVMDARLAKPLSAAVPPADATQVFASMGFSQLLPYSEAYPLRESFQLPDTFDGMYTAQIGEPGKAAGFTSMISAQFGRVEADGVVRNSPYAYLLSWVNEGRMMTGLQRKVADRDLAKVHVDMAAEATGVSGIRAAYSHLPGKADALLTTEFPGDLPTKRIEYYNTEGGIRWNSTFNQAIRLDETRFPPLTPISELVSPVTRYEAGRTYHETWNRGVFGPAFPVPDTYDVPFNYAYRYQNSMEIGPPLYGDSAGRSGSSRQSTAHVNLFRNGVKIGQAEFVGGTFDVPPEVGDYRAEFEVTRGAPFTLSTKTTAVWTFRSAGVSDEQRHSLPLSGIHFTPDLDERNTAPAGRVLGVPFEVVRHPFASAGRAKTVTVQVSYDDGVTWQPATVLRGGDFGVAIVRHPAGGGFVSLKAASTDTAGNTVEQTIIRAYRY